MLGDCQNFNIMFYSIIKKIFKYILALVSMVMGFALANMAIHSNSSGSPFTGLRHSFVKSLIMALGEFNLDDLEATINDEILKNFFYIIVLCTIVFGTLTIVNLFVAVVVSDVAVLREEVFIQVSFQKILN